MLIPSTPTPRQFSPNAWQSWTLAAWNRQLVDYFFATREGDEGPVVVLLVTAEELARAAGASPDAAAAVREHFVDVVRRAIRRRGSLIDDASDYPEWPEPPGPDLIPRFVAHLIFTCVAAAESDDELADERSFILRLRKLSEDHLPDASLASLPTLWRNLARWLESGWNRRRYRPLVLPAPGGLTRIGHTVRLTFPDRRDQLDLARLLHDHGLAGQEPPLRLALQLVSEHRSEFGSRFLAAFDDFRGHVDEDPRSPNLREHRFWAAVRAAALRGRAGATADLDPGVRVQVLADVQDGDHLAPFLVANAPIERDHHICTVKLPYDYGEWTQAVQLRGAEALDAVHLRAATAALLNGSIKIAMLSSLVLQGLLPFVDEGIGVVRLATAEEIDIARIALIRDELVPALLDVFDAATARTCASVHSGWTEVHDISLKRMPSATLQGTTLARCWQLHERPVLPQLNVIGGVRVEDGRLGYKEALPVASAPGAKSLALIDDSGDEHQLAQNDDGRWSLPTRDFVGRVELAADFGGSSPIRRELNFHAAPVTDRYAVPGDPGAWMVEGLIDSAVLGEDAWSSRSDTGLDAERYCERLDLLGPVVGEFVDSPEAAAFHIVRFAGETLGTCVRGDLCGPPTAQVADAGARRRWRKLLRAARGEDPGFDTARRAIGSRLGVLPVVDGAASPPSRPTDANPPSTDPRVDRFVAILAGLAANRAGLPWGEWRDLVDRVLAPPRERAAQVMRAWEEVGCIDVASSARWRNLAVFARAPCLVAVRSGGAFRATLLGLALPSTRAEVERVAKSLHARVESRRSFCSLVPDTITVRAGEGATLARIAARAGIELRWLDLRFTESLAPPRGITQQPPVGYECSTPWMRGFATSTSLPAGTSLVRSFRTGCPDYWTATCDGQSVWTYHPNLALCWATALAREPFFESGPEELRARFAYIPLPLARVVAILGAALPGPDASQGWSHRYLFVSEPLQALVSEVVRSAFSTSVHNCTHEG